MVAASNNIDPQAVILTGDGFGYAFTLMRIFAIGYYQIHIVFFNQPGKIKFSNILTGFADYIGDEQYYKIIVMQKSPFMF